MTHCQYVNPADLLPCPWQKELGSPATEEEESELRLSIAKDGVHDPLHCWRRESDRMVVVGLRRHRHAVELGLSRVPVLDHQFTSEAGAKIFRLTSTLSQRVLSVGERAYMAYHLAQLLTIGSGARTDLDGRAKTNACVEAAKAAKVSTGSLSAMRTVIASGDPELLAGARQGSISLAAAARRAQGEERTANTARNGAVPPTPAEMDVALICYHLIVSTFRDHGETRSVFLPICQAVHRFFKVIKTWDRMEEVIRRFAEEQEPLTEEKAYVEVDVNS